MPQAPDRIEPRGPFGRRIGGDHGDWSGSVAVAGWRSGTTDGKRLSRLMLIFIALTAVLGMIFPRFIDNWGHAGGLLVGVRGRACPSAAHGQRDEAFGVGIGRPDGPRHRRLRRGAVRGRPSRGSGTPGTHRWSAARKTWCMPSAALDRLRRPDHRQEHARSRSKWLNALDQTPRRPGRRRSGGTRPLVDAARNARSPTRSAEELDERLARALAAVRRKYEEDRRQLRRCAATP